MSEKNKGLPARFKSRPMIIALGGLVAYVIFVAAFAIPDSLRRDDDVAESPDPRAEERVEAFADLSEQVLGLQQEIGVARCEADAESIEAGELANRLDRVLDLMADIEQDASLVQYEQKLALLAVVAEVREGAGSLEVTPEQQSLIDGQGMSQSDCATADYTTGPPEADDPPTEEQVAEAEAKVASLESELAEIEPVGVALADVEAVIAPLDEPTVAAAEGRTMVSYYAGTLPLASAETMDAFVEASSNLDAVLEAREREPSADATLSVLARLAEQARLSTEVVVEHDRAVSGQAPDPAPTVPDPTLPTPTQPGPTQPPTSPSPTQPGPTDPGPTEPGPTDPEPTDEPGPPDPPEGGVDPPGDD